MRNFAFLLLFFSISLSAQNIKISEVQDTEDWGEGYEISFYIRDSVTKAPLPGALVTIALKGHLKGRYWFSRAYQI